MEEKVRALRIGILVSVLFALLAIYVELYCKGSVKIILFSFFSGLFGSGMVTVFIYATEYSVLKRKSLEEYWKAAFNMNKRFSSIRVLYYGDSIKEVKERTNKLHTTMQGIILRADYKKDKELEAQISESWKINNWRNHTIDVMKDYVAVTETPIQELENAYGNIYFLTNNKKRDWVYTNIHKPIREKYEKIKGDVAVHFCPYLNGSHHNLAAMIGIIENLQGEFFNVEQQTEDSENGDIVTLSYYNDFCYEMDCRLERFRAEEIYHSDGEKINRTPNAVVTQYWKVKAE